MSLQALLTVPENVQHAAAALAALDRCFLVGFGRLGPEQHDALRALERVCAGTPLGAPVQAAVAALGRSEFVDRHFVALAAARAAVQAAQHDALRAQAAAALGRPAVPATNGEAPPPAADAAGPLENWLGSARHWLTELALAGFRQLEAQTLSPFFATLEHLQGEPAALRLAALLTGFLNELLEALPVAALPAIPVYRWADLWTRAMLASVRLPTPASGRKVRGNLTFLGADLRQHGYFVSADLYALLEPAGEPARTARVTFSAYKVNVLCGPDVWCCLPAAAEAPLRGLSQHLPFKVDGMTLLPGGDLLWDGKAEAGREAPFLELARQRLAPGAAEAPLPSVAAPLDRHPVQIAEPIFLGPYKVVNGETTRLDLGDGVGLPVALARLGGSELKPEHVAASTSMLGLLRFDGGRWEVQPLAVVLAGKKAEVVFTGSGAAQARKSPSKTLSILKERASRLLRQKS
jgi:hypothetical protein